MRIRAALLVLTLLFTGAPAALADPGPYVPGQESQDYKDRLRTGPNQAWFYSGRTNDQSVEPDARRLAQKYHGYTLGMKMDEQKIPRPGSRDPLWETYSKWFAEGAMWDVRVVLGESLRPGNIWEKVELPALKENLHVTTVWKVDRKTGDKECVIWARVLIPVKQCA